MIREWSWIPFIFNKFDALVKSQDLWKRLPYTVYLVHVTTIYCGRNSRDGLFTKPSSLVVEQISLDGCSPAFQRRWRHNLFFPVLRILVAIPGRKISHLRAKTVHVPALEENYDANAHVYDAADCLWARLSWSFFPVPVPFSPFPSRQTAAHGKSAAALDFSHSFGHFFIAGHIIYGLLFRNRFAGFYDLIVPVIFFCGSVFVLMVSMLAQQTEIDCPLETRIHYWCPDVHLQPPLFWPAPGGRIPAGLALPFYPFPCWWWT